MPESFGARLRQRREQQQIALARSRSRRRSSCRCWKGWSETTSRTGRRAFFVAPSFAPTPTPSPSSPTSSSASSWSSTPIRLKPWRPSRRSRRGPMSNGNRRAADPASVSGRLGRQFAVPPQVAGGAKHPAAGAAVAVPAPRRMHSAGPVRRARSAGRGASLCRARPARRDTGGAPLLKQVARILDAVGLIVWVWHPQAGELRPTRAHGYSDKVLAQLPKVGRDADNATASAFRSAQTCVVNSGDLTNGAVVVPLITPAGCVGVLAIELQHGREQRDSVRALATIFAAQLARVIGASRSAEEGNRKLA